MNTRYTILWLVLSFPVIGWCQNKRPEVLIYGAGADSYAAALQSARSNLNTVWILDDNQIVPELTTQSTVITSGENLDAGLWAELLAGTLRSEKVGDSLSAIAKKRINPRIVQNVMDSTIKATRNLTVIREAKVTSVRKKGQYWHVSLGTRERYRVRALVDGSKDVHLFRMAFAEIDSIETRAVFDASYFRSSSSDDHWRTGVAVGHFNGRAITVPLAGLVPADDDNLFFTHQVPSLRTLLTHTSEDIPLLMHIGQAVGAAAAYTAFLKTTSDKLDVRKVQGELLQYRARLMPFTDIHLEDKHFNAIQRIGSTGLLRGFSDTTGNLLFLPDSSVSASELQPVLNLLFSRSQIWFIDHPEVDVFRVSDLFSLIKYIGQRGDELEKQVEKNWSRRFYFDGEYDAQRVVTRRMAAVLLDTYCKPFDVSVGLTGVIQR